MGLKRRLEGRKQNLELLQGQAGEIQELHGAEPHVSEPYTTHGPCLLILGSVCHTTPNLQTGINSIGHASVDRPIHGHRRHRDAVAQRDTLEGVWAEQIRHGIAHQLKGALLQEASRLRHLDFLPSLHPFDVTTVKSEATPYPGHPSALPSDRPDAGRCGRGRRRYCDKAGYRVAGSSALWLARRP